MAKYNFHELKQDRELQWAVIHAVSKLTDEEFKTKIDPKSIEIRLTVEGVEIDFLDFVQHYFFQIENLAEQRAKEILRERLGDLNDTVYEIEEFLKGKLSTMEA